MAAYLGNQVVVGMDVILKIISVVCGFGRKYPVRDSVLSCITWA